MYGARNYAWGISFVSLVVGLALDGEALVGVNYDPMCNEMFHAERGKGAFLNDDPIHVSDRPNLSKSVVGFDLSYAGGDGASNGLQVIQAMLNDVGSTRTWGRRRWEYPTPPLGGTTYTSTTDWNPGTRWRLLLIEEAGGVVTDRAGNRAGLFSDGIIASSAGLHAEFMRRTEGMAWRNPTHRTV
jgi:myo-inositol-1(or 4)-monophosphatase